MCLARLSSCPATTTWPSAGALAAVRGSAWECSRHASCLNFTELRHQKALVLAGRSGAGQHMHLGFRV